MISIHDPVCGNLEVTPQEIRLIDARAFQRLRYIKQLGFAELAFPGATHTRYSHGLGAMHVASGMCEALLADLDMAESERQRLKQTLRLALLFHDLGHPPMSHVSERVMPKVCELGLGQWIDDTDRRATHEDYTIKLLVDSELKGMIDAQFGDMGVTGHRVAALIAGKPPLGDEHAFEIAGHDFLPLLSQVVSSELDADRIDYLRRDAYFCGVGYGNFDQTWLLHNLCSVLWEGKYHMALRHKGVWAFENFLLSRFHMFLAVYYHHIGICFDELLLRFYESGEYVLPSDAEAYLETDDVHLMHALRISKSIWAKHVVQRRAYRLLVETHDFGSEDDVAGLGDRLKNANIDFFRVQSRGVLSKYFKKRDTVFPLLVFEPEIGRVRRVEEYTPLYKRFDDVVGLSRIYCNPEHFSKAQELVACASS